MSFDQLGAGDPTKTLMSTDFWQDMEIDVLMKRIKRSHLNPQLVKNYFENLSYSPDEIRIRQDNIQYLLEAESLFGFLSKFINEMNFLKETKTALDMSHLTKVIRKISELETWVKMVTGLQQAFSQHQGEPRGLWIALKELTHKAHSSSEFESLQLELPPLKAKIQGIRAVSIGINLNHHLEPVGAVLLSIEDEPYQGRSNGFLSKVFQDRKSPLGVLHEPPFKTLQVANQTLTQDPNEHGYAVNPKSLPLFRDLSEILNKTSQELEKKLKQFSQVELEPWKKITDELSLLVHSVQLIQEWQSKGIPLCFPTILSVDRNFTQVEGMVHPPLMMKSMEQADVQAIKPNNIELGDRGRIHIITGPNSGGKTVYLQSIGWAHYLTQLGWPLPARSAQISPASFLCSHFQKEEETGRGAGRFGEEIVRLKTLFGQIKRGDVLLMNESLSGTNAAESSAIAWDLMKALRVKGVRAGYTTHLHDLARDVPILNDEVKGESLVASLVAQVGEFRVIYGEPLGRSFAHEIAKKYGLSFESLI